MHPVMDDDDALGRLEQRVEQLAQIVGKLKSRNAELQRALDHAADERDQAMKAAEEARGQAARLVEEADGLRNRHKDAATRIKSLLEQLEHMDLPVEG